MLNENLQYVTALLGHSVQHNFDATLKLPKPATACSLQYERSHLQNFRHTIPRRLTPFSSAEEDLLAIFLGASALPCNMAHLCSVHLTFSKFSTRPTTILGSRPFRVFRVLPPPRFYRAKLLLPQTSTITNNFPNLPPTPGLPQQLSFPIIPHSGFSRVDPNTA